MQTSNILMTLLALVMFVLAYGMNINIARCGGVSKSVAWSAEILQVLYNTVLVVMVMSLFSGKDYVAVEAAVVAISFVGMVCCSVVMADKTAKNCRGVRNWSVTLLVLSTLLLVGGSLKLAAPKLLKRL